jgi:hypothetical protein
MAKTQQQLLDELDEARIVLKTYHRLMGVGIVGEALSTILVVVAARIKALGEIIAVPIAGMLVALIFMCWWFWWNNSKPVGYGRSVILSPAARLRAAERAYRNSMLDQS